MKYIIAVILILSAAVGAKANNLTQESLDLENGYLVWSASTPNGVSISGFQQYDPSSSFSQLLDYRTSDPLNALFSGFIQGYMGGSETFDSGGSPRVNLLESDGSTPMLLGTDYYLRISDVIPLPGASVGVSDSFSFSDSAGAVVTHVSERWR